MTAQNAFHLILQQEFSLLQPDFFELFGFGEVVAGRQIVYFLVEDVMLVRLLVAETLRSRGLDVVEASSGEEAIALLQSTLGHVQVVVSDIHMPGARIDGLGLVGWVRRHRPEIKVLLGSGVSGMAQVAEREFEAGPVLAKPYDLDQLESHIRDALR